MKEEDKANVVKTKHTKTPQKQQKVNIWGIWMDDGETKIQD